MEDMYLDTAPLEDTVPIESPIPESPLQNFDTNAAVVGICESIQHLGDEKEDYCEKEIVPNSDDEERKHNEDTNLVAGRVSGKVHAGFFRRLSNKIGVHKSDSARSAEFDKESMGGRIGLENTRCPEHRLDIGSPNQTSILKDAKEIHLDQEFLNIVRESLSDDAFDGKNLSSHNSKAMDKKYDAHYDGDHARLNHLESPEPPESQGKALDFVNYYLSVNDLGLSKDVEAGKTNRIRSPPSLRSKGSQDLARRVHLGSTAASKSMTFDWVESQIEKVPYTYKRKMNKSIVEVEGKKCGCLSVNKESDFANMQNEKISSLRPNEKFSLNTLCPNILDTTSMHSNEIDRVGSNSESCIAHVPMKLDEQLDTRLLGRIDEINEQLRDTFDFGLDTQMAAEAMEALIFASPPKSDACFTDKGLENTVWGSSNAVNKSKPKKLANPKEAFSGWRKKEKRSKCVQICTVEIKKEVSRELTKNNKRQRETASHALVSRKVMGEKVLCEKDLNCRKDSETGRPHRITVKQGKDGFAERENRKKTWKYHCLSKSTGCKMDGRRSKDTNDKLKSDAPPKRRKMISCQTDEIKRGVTEKCTKVEFNPFPQVKRINKETGEEIFDLDVASSNLLESNLWTYPKGKRTRQFVSPHSNRSSNQSPPCVAIHEKNLKNNPAVGDKTHKRVPDLLVYTRRRQFSSRKGLSRNSFKLTGDFSSPSVNNEVFDTRIQSAPEFDTPKPSEQFGQLHHCSTPLSVDTLGKLKLDILSNGNSKNLKVSEDNGESKQPCKHLSKSPLMKELIRLGHPESLPEFLPKDSRRRRAMEKVCILFSQNLGANILKQQRKIVVRLGLSIASCCSDATHFVTDRFVRTKNMLEAIALGKPVVTHLWLESCEQAGYVIDEKGFILRDEKKEKELGFSMPVSLTRASQCPLLKGHRVFITPNVKPCMDVIRSLVKAVQGQEVQTVESSKIKNKVIADDLLILSCEEDYDIGQPLLEKGASIYSSELLLNGIVTQKLEYERYQLFKKLPKIGSS